MVGSWHYLDRKSGIFSFDFQLSKVETLWVSLEDWPAFNLVTSHCSNASCSISNFESALGDVTRIIFDLVTNFFWGDGSGDSFGGNVASVPIKSEKLWWRHDNVIMRNSPLVLSLMTSESIMCEDGIAESVLLRFVTQKSYWDLRNSI